MLTPLRKFAQGATNIVQALRQQKTNTQPEMDITIHQPIFVTFVRPLLLNRGIANDK